MRDTELKREKAEALYSVYKKGLQDGRFKSLFDAARAVSCSPAPRYYISAKRASLLIGRIEAHTSLINIHRSQRRQAWHLWFRYKAYLTEHPANNLSRERIMEILIDDPAPEFFLNTEGARKILQAEIKRTRRKLGW